MFNMFGKSGSLQMIFACAAVGAGVGAVGGAVVAAFKVTGSTIGYYAAQEKYEEALEFGPREKVASWQKIREERDYSTLEIAGRVIGYGSAVTGVTGMGIGAIKAGARKLDSLD